MLPDPPRRRRALVPWLVSAVLLSVPVPAQGAEAEAALQEFRQVREGDERERTAAILSLGQHESREITGVLVDELRREGATPTYRTAVLKAIGRAVRPGALRPVLDVFSAPATPRLVRREAARCAIAQGNRGIDALSMMLERPPRKLRGGTLTAVRRAALDALVAADSNRSWRALAILAMEGGVRERLEVLRRLEGAPPLASVERARLDAFSDSNKELAATALVQLVEEGHRNARRLADDLYQRLGRNPSARVRAPMVRALAHLVNRALYDPLLRLSASGAQPVVRAIDEAAPIATEDRGFVRYLVNVGLDMGIPAEREAARHWLRAGNAETVRSALSSLRRRLRNPGPEELELVKSFHQVFADDPSWVEDLIGMVDSSRSETRTVAMSLLADIGGEAAAPALPEVHRNLRHAEWAVRSAAYEFCGRVRHVSSVPKLIGRLDEETHRLREEVLDALQRVTRFRFFSAERWRQWWEESAEGFTLPPPPKDEPDRATARSDGRTQGFFNIPLISQRVAFVIDLSGSMRQRIGTNANRSRLDEAKRQLCGTLEDMPADRFFNVIVYGTDVQALLPRLHRATPGRKEEMTGRVKKLRLRGATNIHGALEEAFNDPDVDTIYLLTDGQPSAGRITAPDALADEVARWNLSRRIVIHCVSIGINSRLLRRLADESGGSFVYVK